MLVGVGGELEFEWNHAQTYLFKDFLMVGEASKLMRGEAARVGIEMVGGGGGLKKVEN